MADLLAFVVIIAGGAGAAELARSTCRRMLLSPVRARAPQSRR